MHGRPHAMAVICASVVPPSSSAGNMNTDESLHIFFRSSLHLTHLTSLELRKGAIIGAIVLSMGPRITSSLLFAFHLVHASSRYCGPFLKPTVPMNIALKMPSVFSPEVKTNDIFRAIFIGTVG